MVMMLLRRWRLLLRVRVLREMLVRYLRLLLWLRGCVRLGLRLRLMAHVMQLRWRSRV